jgi:hypothetical protein
VARWSATSPTLRCHGFAIASDLGRGFSSNGRENKVGIVDLKTLALVQKVDTGETGYHPL